MARSASLDDGGAPSAGFTAFVNAIPLVIGTDTGVPSTPGIWNASPPPSIRRNHPTRSAAGMP
jgi:hypothetical protein